LQIEGYRKVQYLYASDTYDALLYVGYRFMPSTPDSTFVINEGTRSAAAAGAVSVHVFRNVDLVDPMPIIQTATGTNTVLCDPPSITPTIKKSYIIAGGSGAYAGASQTYSSSNLTDFNSSNGQDTTDVVVGAGYNAWTSGAFNPAAFTFSGADSTSNSWVAASISMSPRRIVRPSDYIAGSINSYSVNTSTPSDNLIAPYPSANRKILGIVINTTSSTSTITSISKNSVSQTVYITAGNTWCPVGLFISDDSSSFSYTQSAVFPASVSNYFMASVCVYGYTNLTYSSHQSSGADDVTTRTTPSLTYSAGDLILLVGYNNGENTTLTTTDTNMIPLGDHKSLDGTTRIWYKIASSSTSEAFTVNSTGTGRMSATAYAFSIS
jgi:hypothetical protein